ncbi:MAG: hypothetical protein H7Z43_15990 [Clostridia bacterium]|nr:hypothetical protein [Deltaproteobacteria bacterium]
MILRRSIIEVALCGFLAAATLNVAHAEETPGAVAQSVGHGKIDWTNKTVTATGSGAPDLKAANVAVARLGAERAAKMDALRNIMETVKGVRISSTQTAGAAMDSSPELKAKVEGVAKNFKVVDTKYYSDGGVDLVVQMPIDGVLVETFVPQVNAPTATAPSADTAVSGVIVNAKGLKVTPALAPRLIDEGGKELYGPDTIAHDALLQRGVASYTKSLDQAMRDAKVAGGKPLVLKATRVAAAGGSDVVLSADDAAKLAGARGALDAGRVIIVTD